MTIAGSALFLAIVIVLLMLIPRDEHPVISSILAVLFWITLAAVGFLLYLLITKSRKRKRRTIKRKPVHLSPPVSNKNEPGIYSRNESNSEGIK